MDGEGQLQEAFPNQQESIEAKWLRQNLHSDLLRPYNRQWIAVLGNEIINSSEDPDGFIRDFSYSKLPLIAFVLLDNLQ